MIEERAPGRGWQAGQEIDFKTVPTLPDLVAGLVPGRQTEKEVTCFINNIGLGYQFAALGSLVYRKARGQGVGVEVPTSWFTQDVHP